MADYKFIPLIFLLFSFFFFFLNASEVDVETTDDATESPSSSLSDSQYQPPSIDAFFVETFVTDWRDHWTLSQHEKFSSGRWLVEHSNINEGIATEQGLIVKEAAKHHAIAAEFNKTFHFENGIIVHYDVRFHRHHECGGAYIKLLSKPDQKKFNMEKFNADTPYTIMFGPDKCGGNDKIHLILRYKNPINGVIEEKHLKSPPPIRNDRYTHNYGFLITPDSKYEIFVDGESIKHGSLLNDFVPAINPEKEIDDPNDKKPVDWIDNPMMADPNDKKPDDWDENEIEYIEDTEAVKPEGWLDNGPMEIPDPDQTKPVDWDDELDGEWKPPVIRNPICDSIGCGEWRRPVKKNPKYKGKWSPKQITNPAYKGEWKARKISNPAYFYEENPVKQLTPISALGIEIWTMQNEIEFDNFIIESLENNNQLDKIKQWIQKTWGEKKKIEELKLGKNTNNNNGDKNNKKEPEGIIETVTDYLSSNPVIFAVTLITILATVIVSVLCCVKSENNDNDIIGDEEEESGDEINQNNNDNNNEAEKKETVSDTASESTTASDNNNNNETTTNATEKHEEDSDGSLEKVSDSSNKPTKRKPKRAD